MFNLTSFKVYFVLVITFLILSCNRESSQEAVIQNAGKIDLDAKYPVQNIKPIKLNIKFKAQVPPGEWKETANCTAACYVMLHAYSKGIDPTASMIKEFDDWELATNKQPINNYNGFRKGYPISDLKKYSKYLGIKKTVYQTGNLPILIQALQKGYPVIVLVKRKMNSQIKAFHAMVVIGIDQDNIYVNDPGRAIGNNNSYPLDTFLKVWRIGNNVMFFIDQ